MRASTTIPGISLGFSKLALPLMLYWGPLSKLIFSGLYVPGAIQTLKILVIYPRSI